MRKRINYFDSLSLLVIVINIGYLTITYANYMFFFSLLIWLIVAIIRFPRIINNFILHNPNSKHLFLWILETFLLVIISPDSIEDAIKIILMIFVNYFPLLLLYYYKTKLPNLKFYILIWDAVMLLQMAAIIFNIINPGFARVLATGDVLYGVTFIGGGYPLAYLSVFTCLNALINFENLSSLITKKRVISELILGVCVIYLTQSTITLMALVLGVFLYFLIFRKGISAGLIIFLLICTTIISVFFYNNILNIMYKWTISWNNIFGLKISNIFEHLLFPDATSFGDSVNSRLRVYKSTISFLKKNILLGNGIHFGFQFGSVASIGFGNHSALLDTFAKYGVIFSIPLILLYYKLFKCNLRKNKNYIIYIIVFLFMGFLNLLINFSSMFGMFFLVPYTEMLINQFGIMNHKEGKRNLMTPL